MLNRRQLLALASSAAFGKTGKDVNELAQQYVQLVLAVGRHDGDYVDAYYGPPEWKEEALQWKLSLTDIRQKANALADRFAGLAPSGEELERLRHRYLLVQTRSLASRVAMLEGKRFTFDEESKALYDAEAPVIPEEHFE